MKYRNSYKCLLFFALFAKSYSYADNLYTMINQNSLLSCYYKKLSFVQFSYMFWVSIPTDLSKYFVGRSW